MSNFHRFFLIVFLIATTAMSPISEPDWGFFGHRKINKMAVLTLPQEMIGFYKKHIAYIARESIAPDKRRYSLPVEGVRHYIDLDYFEYEDISEFPRKLEQAIAFNSNIYFVNEKSDSILLMQTANHTVIDSGLIANDRLTVDVQKYLDWNKSLMPFGQREDYIQTFDLDKLPKWVKLNKKRRNGKLIIVDKFSEYGIAPYFIENMYRQLVYAFEDLDGKKILRLSTELGHYLSDIHVPLHTTKNYNGEMTNQLGIHAFWESRLPELYADAKYDFMVGKAEYVTDAQEYIWKTIADSHSLVPEVLGMEKQISERFPDDQQFCYEERNNRTVRIECEEYALAYHEAMGGMVEERMQNSILAVGSFWFSAWVAAGQPDLEAITNDLEFYARTNNNEAADNNDEEGSKVKIRQHNN